MLAEGRWSLEVRLSDSLPMSHNYGKAHCSLDARLLRGIPLPLHAPSLICSEVKTTASLDSFYLTTFSHLHNISHQSARSISRSVL